MPNEEVLAILRDYASAGPVPSEPVQVPYQPREGNGCAATEAPRGLIFHEYRIDTTGKIVSGRIIPPTSQNHKQIERDVTDYPTGRLLAGVSRDDMALDCERMVRTYDPCISCSTHFVKVRWEEPA